MKYIFLLFNLSSSIFLYAQISFFSPDTICQGESFLIQNNSNPNQDYYWSFCGKDISQPPIISTFEVEFLTRPVFMDIQKEGENYYGFVTGVDGELIRLDFGNSLNNNPITIKLDEIGNLFFGMEGIQIINEDNHWWGFIIGGTGNERILRLDFGNSLENIPTTSDLGNIAAFDFPNDLKIVKEGDTWYGITLNRWSGGSISVFSFEDGLDNPPTGLNIGNIGNLSAPTGFSIIQIEQELSIFIANENGASISRIDITGVFNPIPIGTNLGNLNILNFPRDIIVSEQCGNYYGYILDTLGGKLIELNFGNNIKNIPNANTLLEFEDWIFPHSFSSIIRENNTLYLFILDANSNQVTRLKFPGCVDVSIPFHEGFQPPPVVYNQEGTYLIQLLVNEGQPNQTSFCKQITVLPAPNLNLGNDTTICTGDRFSIDSNSPETIWEESSMSSSFEVFESGLYTASINGELCNSYDSIFVKFTDCEKCIIFPNAFTPNKDGQNDIFLPFFDCDIDFLTFQLQIYNRWGQVVFHTDNPMEGWDGVFNNQESTSDVYVWKTIFRYNKGLEIVEESMIGDVSLIR